MQKSQSLHSSLCTYQPCNRNFVQAITPILFEILDNIWYGHISGELGVSHARRTTFALYFFLVNSPERISKPNSCALFIFLMVQVVASLAEPLLYTCLVNYHRYLRRRY